MVLGPLPDAGDPLELRAASPEFTDPGLDREHATVGLAGEPARWVALARSPLRPCVMAESVLDGTLGWALVACAFDAPAGRPSSRWRPPRRAARRLPSARRRRRGRTLNPFGSAAAGGLGSAGDADAHAYSFSLNGEPAIVVDPRGRPGSPLRAHPVVLRDGPQPAGLRRADGRARRARGARARARRLAAPAPRRGASGRPAGRAGGRQRRPPRRRRAAWTSCRPCRCAGADEQALLGVLLGIDGRPAEGLAHVRPRRPRAGAPGPGCPARAAHAGRRLPARHVAPNTRARAGRVGGGAAIRSTWPWPCTSPGWWPTRTASRRRWRG